MMTEAVPSDAGEYVLEEQVGFKLRKAHQRASDLFLDVMKGFNITPTQFAALSQLHAEGTLSLSALGRKTTMDTATVFGVVSRLRQRGLVDQVSDPDDGRAVRLSLTARGKNEVQQMLARGAEVSNRILAPLKPDDRARFLAALDALSAS